MGVAHLVQEPLHRLDVPSAGGAEEVVQGTGLPCQGLRDVRQHWPQEKLGPWGGPAPGSAPRDEGWELGAHNPCQWAGSSVLLEWPMLFRSKRRAQPRDGVWLWVTSGDTTNDTCPEARANSYPQWGFPMIAAVACAMSVLLQSI